MFKSDSSHNLVMLPIPFITNSDTRNHLLDLVHPYIFKILILLQVFNKRPLRNNFRIWKVLSYEIRQRTSFRGCVYIICVFNFFNWVVLVILVIQVILIGVNCLLNLYQVFWIQMILINEIPQNVDLFLFLFTIVEFILYLEEVFFVQVIFYFFDIVGTQVELLSSALVRAFKIV